MALAAAALVAVVLALIAWLAVRARNRSEERTRDAVWQISQVMDQLADRLERATLDERDVSPTITLPVTLDLDEGLRRVAAMAAALPGMTAGAVRVDLADGTSALKTVGITSGATGLEHEPEPPDGAVWRTATISWAHDPVAGTAGGRPIQTGVVVPVADTSGVRIGLVAGYTSAPEVPPEIVDAMAALGASAAPGLAAAREHEALRELVRTDPRTGLFNQRGLEEALAREIARATRTGAPLSILMIDLDDFRRFNKTSHQVGDEMLRGFARVLREACRESDVPCRRGAGEEFTVVLPDTTCTAAHRVDARIRALVATADLPLPAGETPLTYSAGITTFRDGDDAKTLDDRTSALVNEAKRAGKDTVQSDCAPAEIDEPSVHHPAEPMPGAPDAVG